MSSPHTRIPPLPVRERAACMCLHGETCSTFGPGHAVHLIQARLASATPTEWVDTVVESAHDDGTITLRTIADDTAIVLWNGAGAGDTVAAGTPVALHGRYHVLAVGRAWFNVAPIV